MATGVGLRQILLPQLNCFDPENPLLREGMGVVSPIQTELLSIFCRKFQIFVAMATGVGLAQILLALLNSPTPITPY